MADTKITALSAFTQVDPAADLFVAVDVSDPAMAASGTDKKLTSTFLRFAVLSEIYGVTYEYVNTDTVRVTAGTMGINGRVVNVAAASYNITGAAASQAKNIAGTNITSWITNSAYFVFVKDDGTVAFEIYDGTGDGAAPVLDLTYGYFRAASSGPAWRRIGKFFTGATDTILVFKVSGSGRERRYWLLDQTAKLLVSGAVSDASMTPVPNFGLYLSADDSETRWMLTATGTNPNANLGVMISVDGGALAVFQSITNTGFALVTNSQFGVETSWCPYTGMVHYQTVGASPGYVGIAGVKFSL